MNSDQAPLGGGIVYCEDPDHVHQEWSGTRWRCPECKRMVPVSDTLGRSRDG